MWYLKILNIFVNILCFCVWNGVIYILYRNTFVLMKDLKFKFSVECGVYIINWLYFL